jgi:hypothetical protein
MKQDVARASKFLEEVANATTTSDFEAAWYDFLVRLERAWELTNAQFHREHWFQKTYSPYAKLRKKDPLLRYLKQARNAETHSLQGSLDAPLSIHFKEKYGRPFSVERIKSSIKGGVLSIDIDSPDILLEYEASLFRQTPQLTRFKNRGKWYNVPTHHLGNSLTETSPLIIGKLGLDFCKAFVGEVERARPR